jgi:multiple sugar transport system substrate-binding protein
MLPTPRPTRRQLLTVAAMAPAPFLLGCFAPNAPRSGSDAPIKAASRVPAQVWTGWTEDAAKRIERVVGEFNDSQDKVDARHVVVPGDISQKLLAAINAGKPPEAAIVFGAGIAYQLAARGALLAFDDVGDQNELDALRTWMTPAMRDLAQYDGRDFYLPIWSQCWGTFVNTDMARKRGVDPDSPPQTLDELDEAWEKLTVYDENGDIDILGGDTTDLYLTTARHLGRFVTEDGKTITANDANNIKAAQWMDSRWQRVGRKKLQRYYASLQGRGERSASLDPFLAGLTATTTTGPWEFGNIVDYAPDGFNYTVWPFPRPAGVDKTGTYTYGDGFVLPKKSQSPQAGWEIARWLSGATGDEALYSGLFSSWLCVNSPTSEEVLDWQTFQDDVIAKCPGYDTVFLEDMFNSDYYVFPPKIPTSLSYYSLLQAEWEKVIAGRRPLQEAFDDVTERAQAELDRWHEENA